jgi:integrase/recombinase XerD
MAATILSAGIKPGEALTLAVSQIRFAGLNSASGEVPEKLSLPGNGNNGPRECPIAQWGQIVLGEWMATRRRIKITTHHVFPAGLSNDQSISKTTFYRQFAKLLGELSITTPKRGAHMLRHTFAVRQLEQGKRQKAVQDWLGLEDCQSMSGYYKVARR